MKMLSAPSSTRSIPWPLRASAGTEPRYALAVAGGQRRALASAWLWLAIAALLASGVFSILLVVARAPFLQPLLPTVDFFRVALVVHVDLSVLVWFASFAGVLWSVAGTERWLALAWTAFGLAVLGAAAMSAAAFVNPGAPVMANYVPVLDSGLFLWGLVVFGAGFGLASLRALAVPQKVGAWLAPDGALRFGLNASAVAAAMALLALVWSWTAIPSALDAKTYYELLFWGPGHVVQFCWSLLMMVAWLWLATLSGARVPLSPRVAVLLFAIGLVAVFATPVIYLAWDVASVEHRKLFTWQMRFGGGLAIVPMAIAVLLGLARAAPVSAAERPSRTALVASLVLFSAGGLIGFLIKGSDVRVPAHYHGSIVGITLALMGLTYALLPRLGYTRPLPRLAIWQPALYGAGQFLHIAGLVWSGGYGVQRKVAGAEQVLRTPSEVAGMALMGVGGLIAVIGGLAFALVVLRTLRRGKA
ncbi:MAG: cbb3-type cytochrome c oxidase subunit I [Burkholderiaceae bacterium]